MPVTRFLNTPTKILDPKMRRAETARYNGVNKGRLLAYQLGEQFAEAREIIANLELITFKNRLPSADELLDHVAAQNHLQDLLGKLETDLLERYKNNLLSERDLITIETALLDFVIAGNPAKFLSKITDLNLSFHNDPTWLQHLLMIVSAVCGFFAGLCIGAAAGPAAAFTALAGGAKGAALGASLGSLIGGGGAYGLVTFFNQRSESISPKTFDELASYIFENFLDNGTSDNATFQLKVLGEDENYKFIPPTVYPKIEPAGSTIKI